ncbi:MAG: porphobilinogen synthase [Clostridiales bacterium]|nr:MAG: porphobilinogen synthase [Clostridiales bacterium]
MDIRPRRLRKSESIRKMIRETRVSASDLIMPFFIVEGTGVKREISSMPGVYQLSIDKFVEELKKVEELGILGVILFGVPNKKDEVGSGAYDREGIVQRALREAKPKFKDLVFIADVCLCEYTSHGHCGLLVGDKVDNDSTLPLLAKTAVSLAEAGADIVAPSDMMDGRINFIRKALDENGHTMVNIMAYSVKYSSNLYSPFRDAADSAPSFDDRKSYQMDFANSKEALKIAEIDSKSGADFIMVKPAMLYLDIVSKVSNNINLPVVAYNISGEYSMVKAAAKMRWIDEKKVVEETLLSIKRAGASLIITYHALDYATWLKEGSVAK